MLRCLLIISLIIISGCSRNTPAMKHVTIAELETATKGQPFFSYSGSDDNFHYFRTLDGQRYSIERSAWDMPVPFPADGTMEVFVSIKDGEITTPNPSDMKGVRLRPPRD